MSHPLFDVARRQLSIAHHNGERARRFALDPPKARWYAVYRSARLATRGLSYLPHSRRLFMTGLLIIFVAFALAFCDHLRRLNS